MRKVKKKKESLVKIVRNESLGNYSWDSSESSINSGWGVNEWSQADLMYELNCDGKSTKYCRDDITEGYLSNLTTGSTTWYNNSNNAKTGTYEYRKNIRSLSIDKVAKVRWNLGGYNTVASALNMYNAERGTLHVSNPSDGITRTNTWDGKIALIYPSDYGYATVGGTTTNKSSCRAKELYNWYDSSYSDCKNNDWVYKSQSISWGSNKTEWLISPSASYSDCASYLIWSGYVNAFDDGVDAQFAVRPTFYLDSSILKIVGTGDGTKDNAYRVG